MRPTRPWYAAAVPLAAVALALPPTAAQADNGTNSTRLRNAVTGDAIQAHLDDLQAIASANGGTRAAGTPGHTASAAYVANLLAAAGYTVRLQAFSYPKWTLQSAPTLAQTAPGSVTYGQTVDYEPMDYSGSGDVTAAVVPVDLQLAPNPGGSTSGCEAADFATFPSGSVALIQRGTCTFNQKAANAEAAGASGAIIFNEGNTPDRSDLLFGTLGAPAPGNPEVTIPVVGTTFALGNDLAAAGATVHLVVDADTTTITTDNVLADTPGGRADRLVVAGGHLDSVTEGPGIEDNGTGTMTLLEIAQQMAALGITPRNKVRFAFWSGEEDGLVGSQYYVDQLTKAQVKQHAVNLNFDMIGSPNGFPFVYDGDGSDTGASGPNGSDIVEGVFARYLDAAGIPHEATAFDGRSDYGPFIDRGIPAGGLFTGAEGAKTQAQADLFGGTAGVAYDPCYHLACDTADNIDTVLLGQMADAAAHAILTFAMTTSAVNGTAQGRGGGSADMGWSANRTVK